MVSGLSKECFSKIDLCEGCLLGKMPQHPFPIQHSKCQNPLQLVHNDICGPSPTKSITGSHYFISFVDDYSHFKVVTFLETKVQATWAFKNDIRLRENIIQRSIQQLQTNGGCEYCSRAFNELYQAQGIRHRISAPHTQQ